MFHIVTLCKYVDCQYSGLLQWGSDTNSVLQNIPPNFQNCSSSNDNSVFTDMEYSLSLSQKPVETYVEPV